MRDAAVRFAYGRSFYTLALLVVAGFIGMMVGQFLSIGLCYALWHMDYPHLQQLLQADLSLTRAHEKYALYLVLGLNTLTTFLIPALIILRYRLQTPLNVYFQPLQSPLKSIVLGLGICACALCVNSVLVEWNTSITLPETMKTLEGWMRDHEERIQKLTYALLIPKGKNAYFFLINLLVFAALPALGEEFFFRGLLQKKLTDTLKNPHAAILITALLFSLIHLQFYGLIPRLFLGALFGYLFYFSNHLSMPIFAHFTNNAYAVSVLFFAKHNPNTPTSPPLYLLLIALIAGVWLTRQFMRLHRFQIQNTG